jgi:hypothetical protein
MHFLLFFRLKNHFKQLDAWAALALPPFGVWDGPENGPTKKARASASAGEAVRELEVAKRRPMLSKDGIQNSQRRLSAKASAKAGSFAVGIKENVKASRGVIRNMTGADEHDFHRRRERRESGKELDSVARNCIREIRADKETIMKSKGHKRQGMHYGMVGDHKSHLITRYSA